MEVLRRSAGSRDMPAGRTINGPILCVGETMLRSHHFKRFLPHLVVIPGDHDASTVGRRAQPSTVSGIAVIVPPLAE